MKLLSTRLAASALSFAHLANVGRPKAARAADDDEDDRKEKDARAAGDDDDSDESQNRDDGDSGKGKKGKKAKADDPDAEDDDDRKENDARAADSDDDDERERDEDEDDDEDELRGKSAIARARLREQARCAAIMGSHAAGRNVVLAAQLALTTRMTRGEAINVLARAPAAVTPVNDRRAARNPNLGAGGSLAQDPKAAIEASWDRAMQKVGAVRRK